MGSGTDNRLNGVRPTLRRSRSHGAYNKENFGLGFSCYAYQHGSHQDLEQLTGDRLKEVADFIAFLKFRQRRRGTILDPTQLAALFTEFADEDRALAEAGINDYSAMLDRED